MSLVEVLTRLKVIMGGLMVEIILLMDQSFIVLMLFWEMLFLLGEMHIIESMFQ